MYKQSLSNQVPIHSWIERVYMQVKCLSKGHSATPRQSRPVQECTYWKRMTTSLADLVSVMHWVAVPQYFIRWSMTYSVISVSSTLPLTLKVVKIIWPMTVACDFGLRGLGYRSRLPRCGCVSLGKTLHLHVHSLDPGVNGYLIGQRLLVCLHSTSAVMATGLYAPQGGELVLERANPITRENWCEARRNLI